MDLTTLALFAATEFLLSLTPGPAVLMVAGLALRHGQRIGITASLGIVATNAVFFTLSALGVGALILASAALFTILKWIGAAYLVWLGLRMIAPLIRADRNSPSDKRTEPAPHPRTTSGRAFRQGFALQASNPKNLAFFVAILPQFISPEAEIWGQMLVLGAVSVALELPILLAYGAIAAASAPLMRARTIAWIEALGGGVLIGLGGALAASDRR